MPSTATTIDTDCKLMLHMDGVDASTTFTDSELNTPKTVTAVGNAQIDTAQSEFGGASGLFDGTGDYLSCVDSADWNFGTGDFTVDFWVRLSTVVNGAYFVIRGAGPSFGIRHLSTFTEIDVYLAGAAKVTGTWAPSTNTWYHLAVTRSGTSLQLFVNGTSIGSVTDSTNVTDSDLLTIGGTAAGNEINGWLDELRIVKGTAVWTSNFTAPVAAYTGLSSSIKKISGVAIASIKTVSGVAIASVKKAAGV